MEPKIMRLRTAAKLEILSACFVILCAGSLFAQRDQYDNAVSAGGKWTVSRAEDPMTAEKKVHLQVPADNSVAGEELAQINLYCTNGKLKLADFHPNVPLARLNCPGFWGQQQMRVRVSADDWHGDHEFNHVNDDVLAMDTGTTLR